MNNAARKKRTSLSWPHGRLVTSRTGGTSRVARHTVLAEKVRPALPQWFWQRRSGPRCHDDNHDIADVTLSWIAEPAVARGLRLRPGTTFRGDLDLAALPVHDSFRLVSNLWGLLGSSVRRFKEMS